MLYLHEIIDIVGTGQEAYLGTVGERARHSESQGISRLMGTWKVIGSTHRWPLVVNLWEMDGWEHWAETLERQFLPEKVDHALAPWWAKATAWRSGGFDRILEPAPYSPTRAHLRESGLCSWVCTHTTYQLHPGRRAQFLAVFGAALKPALERRGLTLFGAYAATMRSDEVIAIWAAADFRSLCAAQAEPDDRDLSSWKERLPELCASWETMWLVPSADCFFHPNK
jgi:hypothetical protein